MSYPSTILMLWATSIWKKTTKPVIVKTEKNQKPNQQQKQTKYDPYEEEEEDDEDMEVNELMFKSVSDR